MTRALRHLAIVLGSLTLLLGPPSAVLAQPRDGFRLDRYLAPPTTEDGLALQLPTTLGDLRFSVGLMVDYAHEPLVLTTPDRTTTVGPIVENRLVGHVVGALGVTDRIEFHLRLPVVLFQSGTSPQIGGATFGAPDVAGVGDGAVGGSVRIVGERDDGFQLGLSAELVVPLSTSTALAGDLSVAARGQLLAAYAVRRAITIAVNVGGAYRPDRDFGTARIGSELTFGLGVYVTAIEPLVIALEVFGATSFRDPAPFALTNTPLEALLGLRYTIEGVTISGGVGTAITTAPGVPDVRALLGVGYAPPVRAEAVAVPEIAERAPEVSHALDTDGDGIVDPEDACVRDPEDLDRFEDQDGCPDADNDGDRILDDADRCPNEAEDQDQFEDADGCPDLDDDHDGIDVPTDACPTVPETPNGYEDHDGCPDVIPEQAVVDELSLRILFPHNRVRPNGASRPVIAELAEFLRTHPEVTRLRIEGHADATGDSEYNQTLSEARASRVRDLLVELGIDASRLEVVGYGATHLDALGEDEGANAANRRVVFSILARSGR